MSSFIAQLVLSIICYEIRITNESFLGLCSIVVRCEKPIELRYILFSLKLSIFPIIEPIISCRYTQLCCWVTPYILYTVSGVTYV